MLKSYKFILLSAISFNSICYGMESKIEFNSETSKKLNNKQLIDNNRSKSLNNYPEKKSFLQNNITNNESNINNIKSNNNSNNKNDKKEDIYWKIIQDLTCENKELKDQIEFLQKENSYLKIQNEQVQQELKKITIFAKDLQKQAENNNSEQQRNNTQIDEYNNTIQNIYTQYTNLQKYNSLLLDSINNFTKKLQFLEEENAKKDKKIRYRDWKIYSKNAREISNLKSKNKNLYSKLQLARSRSNSVSMNTSYNNLSSYNNYKSYRNINYNNSISKNNNINIVSNKNYRKSYSMQKGFETYNQLLDKQIKDLKKESNEQSKNNKLDHQIANNQNSTMNIINNINNNKNKNIIKNEEEANQVFGNETLDQSNIENQNNIIGLSKNKNPKKKKHKKKNKAKNNNINIINTNEIDVKEEKQSINSSDNTESINKQNQIPESNNINNEEYKKEDVKEAEILEDKKEDIKEDEKLIDKYEEDKKIDTDDDQNYYIDNQNETKDLIEKLKNGLTSNNLNNETNFINNINNIRDNLTIIPEDMDDGSTVITDYNENMKKNKNKNMRRKLAKKKKNEEFYNAFKDYEDDNIKINKNEDTKENNEIIIKELIKKREQIIKNTHPSCGIKELSNTKKNYFNVLRENNEKLKSFVFDFNFQNKEYNIYDKICASYMTYKTIELEIYNNTLHEYDKSHTNNKFKNLKLLKLELGKDTTERKLNSIAVKELYFNAFKNKLFLSENINVSKEIKNALIDVDNFLKELFKPLTTHNEKMEDILNNWEKNNINNTVLNITKQKNSLIKDYIKYFLIKIKQILISLHIINNKVNNKQNILKCYEDVKSIFTEQIGKIIDIIKNNEFNNYRKLINQVSNDIEDKLASKYWYFNKLNYFIKDCDPNSIDEKTLDDCVYNINNTEGIEAITNEIVMYVINHATFTKKNAF